MENRTRRLGTYNRAALYKGHLRKLFKRYICPSGIYVISLSPYLQNGDETYLEGAARVQ